MERISKLFPLKRNKHKYRSKRLDWLINIETVVKESRAMLYQTRTNINSFTTKPYHHFPLVIIGNLFLTKNCTRRRIKSSLPRIKSGQTVPIGAPGYELGRDNTESYYFEATKGFSDYIEFIIGKGMRQTVCDLQCPESGPEPGEEPYIIAVTQKTICSEWVS